MKHDVRDFLLNNRAMMLGMTTGRCVDACLCAARLLDVKNDPPAICLAQTESFDMAKPQVAHDLLAAVWRFDAIPLVGGSPAPRGTVSHPLRSPQDFLDAFRRWLKLEPDLWERSDPVLLRLFCLVLRQQNTANGYLAGIDLFDHPSACYPLPRLA